MNWIVRTTFALAALALAAPQIASAGDKSVARSTSFGGSCPKCELSGRRLTGARFVAADFREAAMVGSDLREAQFIGSNFVSANLSKADLTEAEIVGSNF